MTTWSKPVAMTVTRISPCIAGSCTAPKMISASSPTASWMISLIWCTSPSVRSAPPVMFTSTPVAPEMLTLSSSGDGDRLLRRFHRAVLAAADAGAHERRAAALHDGAHVGEVDVHETGDADERRDALRRVQQDFVGLLERVLERNALADHGEQPLVRHDDHRVDVLAHLGDALLRLTHALASLEQERLGDDADA